MTTTVEQALEASHVLITVREIMRETGHAEPVVRAELRRLAGIGLIEHIPGRGRYDGRYGLLRPIAKAAPAAGSGDVSLIGEGKTDADSEGGETDVTPAVQAPRTLRLTAAAQADREEFESEFGIDGNCSCHLSAPCRSCTHPGNPIQQDADECWEPDGETDIVGVIVERVKENADEMDPAIVRAAAHVELHRENERLNAELNDVAAAIGSTEFMDPPDGGNVTLSEQVRRMRVELGNATALASKLEHILGVERQTSAALREQLDHITHGGEPTAQGLSASLIHSYAVVAPKRKIRRFSGHDSAVKSAMAAASNGSKRGEVFALVHVGTAKRGAVFHPSANGKPNA